MILGQAHLGGLDFPSSCFGDVRDDFLHCPSAGQSTRCVIVKTPPA
jgi:hypothetical protein